jgi:hypothetical protein
MAQFDVYVNPIESQRGPMRLRYSRSVVYGTPVMQ